MSDTHQPRDLEHYRKLAKERVRRQRHDPEPTGGRYLLADAQHELAREAGFRSWAELRQQLEHRPATPRERLRAEIERSLPGTADTEETTVDPGATFPDGVSVRVTVRRRGRRYDLDDGGAAVARAGRPEGWADVAGEVVDERGLNVNRRGVVFVPAVAGRDLAVLAEKVAETSLAVYTALVEELT